jgi:anhydro-N-acetylmuramic acid kinase
MKNKATVLGLMSGSSLDGLDACLSNFTIVDGIWSFDILKTATFELSSELKSALRNSSQLSSDQLLVLDVKYGRWIADQIVPLASDADLVSIHGHTVFHDPKEGYSLQVGSGETISLFTKKPVVSNFRNTDILLGGQGAPLVPMGEKLLFPEYDGFLNLGGICNATFKKAKGVLAGDVGPFNQVFNHYARILGCEIDESGKLSASGTKIPSLIEQWESNDFFKRPFPKSLANQWVTKYFLQISDHKPEDVMHSFAHFISDQLSQIINEQSADRVMVTGGGVHHTFTTNLLAEKCNAQIIKPSPELINFKEALIFGLLGLLRYRGETNVLASSTGASRDSSSGVVYEP